MGDIGPEHPSLALSRIPISAQGGAKSDARDISAPNIDAELTKIIAAWSRMPDHIKVAIKALSHPYAALQAPE